MVTEFRAFIEVFSDPEIWRYIAIPFISAVVGAGTNWLAIKMTFFPVHFIGIKPPYLGWQGIVPRLAGKFGGSLADHSLMKVGGIDAIAESLDYEGIKKHLLGFARPLIEEMIADVMTRENRVLWESLPGLTKRMVYRSVLSKMENQIDDIIDDLRNNAERMIDLREVIVNKLNEDPQLINEIIFTVSEKELKFLVNSGFAFGFLFGVVQTFVWYLYPSLWVLPLFGVLVGTVTNWLAIQLIFRPVYPKKIGPFTFQGVFLKRQSEVSEQFCAIFTHRLLNIQSLVKEMLHGKHKDRTRAMIRKYINKTMDGNFIAQTVGLVTMGPKKYADLKSGAVETAIKYTAELAEDEAFNAQQAARIENMLNEFLSEQDPAEFQNLVRPIFEEDEWLLVLIGGVLGGLAGWGQLVWLFGHVLIERAAEALQRVPFP